MAADSDVDLNAGFYFKNSKLQLGAASRLLEICKIKPNETVLDVGCGDGKITAQLSKAAPKGKVIGVDASSSMIVFAKGQHPSSEFPNLEFKLGKIEDQSFKDKFDHIFSFSCFHWVRKPHEALRSLCKSLKKGGELTFLTYPQESLYYEFMQKALKAYPEYKHLSAYNTMLSIEEYQDILKGSNMSIELFTPREIMTSHSDLDELKAFIKGWLTSFVPLPESEHDKYINLVIEESLSYQILSDDGRINLPYTELIIKATKLS